MQNVGFFTPGLIFNLIWGNKHSITVYWFESFSSLHLLSRDIHKISSFLISSIYNYCNKHNGNNFITFVAKWLWFILGSQFSWTWNFNSVNIFSSPEPKAHRWAYSIPMVRRPSVVRRPQCSNIFFSETAWPIKAKFYVEPPWVGGTKVCSRHLSHMTKMAATPI